MVEKQQLSCYRWRWHGITISSWSLTSTSWWMFAGKNVSRRLEECKATAWAIAPDGGRYRGAEAVNAVVAVALGSAVPLLRYSLPGIRQLQDFIYYLVASNRSLLPGDQPYCAQHPAECL